MTETIPPCVVCGIPVHPAMHQRYGACGDDHGTIASLLAEVKRLNALLEQERVTSRMLRAALDRIAQKVGEEKDGWGRTC